MGYNQLKIISIIAQHVLDNFNPQDKKGIVLEDLINQCVYTSPVQVMKWLDEAKFYGVVSEIMNDQGHQVIHMDFPIVLLEKIAAGNIIQPPHWYDS